MLEAANNIGTFTGWHIAVYHLGTDISFKQVRVDGVDGAAKQSEDDDLARCLFHDFFQHRKPWGCIELNDFLIICVCCTA